MPSHPPATSSEAALQENVAVSSERLRSLAGSSGVQPSRRSIKKKKKTHIRIFLTFFFCPSAHHLHTVCLLRFGLSRRDKRGQNCHAGCGASDAFAQSGQRSLSKALAPDPLLQPPQLVCLFFVSLLFNNMTGSHTPAWPNLICFSYFSQVKSRQHLQPCAREAAIKGGRALGSQLAINHSYWHLL